MIPSVNKCSILGYASNGVQYQWKSKSVAIAPVALGLFFKYLAVSFSFPLLSFHVNFSSRFLLIIAFITISIAFKQIRIIIFYCKPFDQQLIIKQSGWKQERTTMCTLKFDFWFITAMLLFTSFDESKQFFFLLLIFMRIAVFQRNFCQSVISALLLLHLFFLSLILLFVRPRYSGASVFCTRLMSNKRINGFHFIAIAMHTDSNQRCFSSFERSISFICVQWRHFNDSLKKNNNKENKFYEERKMRKVITLLFLFRINLNT